MAGLHVKVKTMIQQQSDTKPTLRQVISSVLAAMLGVQSDKNRERDFTKGKFSTYIIVGLIATLLFVLVVWGVVQAVLYTAAGH